MFLDFLILLRDHRLKVGLSEWLTLMSALKKLIDNSLEKFYLVQGRFCKTSLVDI